ncbi:hypothetical protein [Sphingomonas profundi]|uniref:hypothetical protein n=1 Tax=Alterirhizorhabdus profundi TaxID=2681549 RepID=UPI0012E8CC0A|nr:hypothetical protein [Sphingomonas profundi]
MTIAVRRTVEMAAVFMIGDGLLGLVQPRRHVALWRSDVAALDALVRPFGGRPGRRRAYGVLQVAAGLALATALRPSDKSARDGGRA